MPLPLVRPLGVALAVSALAMTPAVTAFAGGQPGLANAVAVTLATLLATLLVGAVAAAPAPAPAVTALFLPLAASLFLVTTTAWTLAQTVILRAAGHA